MSRHARARRRLCSSCSRERSPSGPTTGLPPILRDVGFDQRLGEQVPLDLPFRDETGRTVTLRQYLGDKPVLLVPGVLRVPDAVHAGAERRRERAPRPPLRHRPRVPRRHGELQPARRPASWPPRRRPTTSRSIGGPAPPAGWHFLVGDETSIRPLLAVDRLPLRLGRRRPSSTPTPAASWSSRPAGRVSHYFYGVEYRAARSAPRARGGVERADRLVRRPAPAVLLPLRPDHRPVQPRGAERRPRSAAC